MSEERVQRRLAAILAADVVGYSRLVREDEEGTLGAARLRRCAYLRSSAVFSQTRVGGEILCGREGRVHEGRIVALIAKLLQTNDLKNLISGFRLKLPPLVIGCRLTLL